MTGNTTDQPPRPAGAEPTLGELLPATALKLAAVSDTPRLDAELLLARAIDMPRSYLFAHPEDTPDPAAVQRFADTVTRRLAGEPLAYITGMKEFWSLELMVSPATLVPRPETELLVELALREIPRRAAWQVLDLGTGSGAIALAIARERPGCQVVGVDRSLSALDVARQNARQLEIANIEFLAGDWIAPVRQRRFEIVVSNPPYVCIGDPALAALGHEPQTALVSGADGLDAIRRLAADCPAVLGADGWLLLEHGAGQAGAVAAILRDRGFAAIHCAEDHAGLPRVTRARLLASSPSHTRIRTSTQGTS